MRTGWRGFALVALVPVVCAVAVAGVPASPAAGEAGTAVTLVVHFVAVESDPVAGGRRVGEVFGCGDRLVAVEVEPETEIEPATVEARITAALAAQFAAEDSPRGGLYDALARSTLRVDRVEPVPALPGAYRVHLGGNLRLGGACDAPRVRHQLEATATQFPEVEGVEIFLGEEPLDAVLAARGTP